MNAKTGILNRARSRTDLLLAEAHDNHLVTGFFSGSEKLLEYKKRMPRTDAWQKAFSWLLENELIQECAREGFDDSDYSRAIFAPTSEGLEYLRDLALGEDLGVTPTQARWVDEPVHLDWPDALMAWESYQGEILGDVRDANGVIIGEEVVLAEVGLYRFSASLGEACRLELAQALDGHPELQSYQALARDESGCTIALEDLPAFAGLPNAGSSTLVILDRLKIRSHFLGLGLGAQILRRLFLRYGPGGGVGVITPFPLQFGGRSDIKEMTDAYAAAEESLRRYYQRLGFAPHPSHPSLMVCDLAKGPLAKLPVGQQW